VYQLLDYFADGLNFETPSAFCFEEEDNKLTRLVAYYLAHALVNREALLERKDPSDAYGGVILLYFQAKDSLAIYATDEFREPILQTFGADENSPFSKQYDYYSGLDMWVKSLLEELIIKQYLLKYSICFAHSGLTRREYRFVSPRGQEKLREEWPEIWEEFGLDKYVTD